MTNRLGMVLAIAAGYLLGRTKKAKWALSAGGMILGKRLNLTPQQLAGALSEQLKANPQLATARDQLRGDLRDAGRAARSALLTRRLDALADTLHERTLGVRDRIGSGALPGGGAGAEEERAGEPEEAEEEAREAPGGEEEEQEPPGEEREQPEPAGGDGRREARAGKGPARKAPAGRPPAKKAPSSKEAAGKGPAKKPPAKSVPAKKTAAKKPPAKKTAPGRSAPGKKAAKKTAARRAGGGEDG